MTLQETIAQVKDSFGDSFSKNMVLQMLHHIAMPEPKVIRGITGEQIGSLSSTIVKYLTDNTRVIDCDGAEFDIELSHNNRIEVSIQSIDFDEDALEEEVQEAVMDWITENFSPNEIETNDPILQEEIANRSINQPIAETPLRVDPTNGC